MKNLIVLAFFSLSSLFMPVLPLIILVGFFVLADTFFGIANSLYHKKKITSVRLSAIIYKLLIYEVVLLLAFGIDLFILSEVFKIWTSVNLIGTKAVAALLASIEAFSIDEKIRSMNKGKGFRFYLNRAWKEIMDAKKEFDKFK